MAAPLSPPPGTARTYPGPCVDRWYDQPLAFAPDSSALAIGGMLAVRLYDPSTGIPRWTLPLPARATAFAFTPDGVTLAIGLVDGRIVLCHTADGTTLRTFARPQPANGKEAFDQDAARPLAFSPDGLLLAAGYASFAALWRLAADVPPTDVPPTLMHGRGGGVAALAFTGDGGSLLITQAGVANDLKASPSFLSRWRVAEREAGDSAPLPLLGSARLTGTGPTLAMPTDRGVAFWPIALAPTADRAPPAPGEQRNAAASKTYSSATSIQRLAFSPRGDFLAGATTDRVYLWDAVAATEVAAFPAPGFRINGVAVASGGTIVAATFSDGTLLIWNR